MAKSIRSKQKRRMRAIKRIRYGEKELKRLVEMVSKSKENETRAEKEQEALNASKKTSMDIDTNDKSSIENFISIKPMETDQMERNSKTLLNKFGQYPEWMNGRRLKKQKKKVKRLKKTKKA